MSQPVLLGPLLQLFFTDHLVAQKRLSEQTVASYRDTFRLLLRFVHSETGVGPASLAIPALDAPSILRFLDNIEKERSNAVVSRNLRLTAIRTFFRFVALRDPASVGVASRVLAIPMKRADTKVRDYLTSQEIDAILAVFDQKKWLGQRNYALLLTMYNTGARVSEMVTLRQDQVNLDSKGYVRLYGKGRKERIVPLWPKTSRVLQGWFANLPKIGTPVAFPNRTGEQLTRFAVHLLLQKAANQASQGCPSLTKKAVSPHKLRHGTAMALLESGVDLAVIALWLGHECLETTNIYLHSNLAMKEKALGKIAPPETGFRRFQADDSLLAFLDSL